MTEEEVAADIEKYLGILRKRHITQGWTEDVSGHLIPPGWVRRDDGGEAGVKGSDGDGR